jgi:hypothetical protein
MAFLAVSAIDVEAFLTQKKQLLLMEVVEMQMNVVITGAKKGIGLELVKCY